MTSATPCALGIDLGTGGVKAVLVGLDGNVLARADRTYEFDSDQPGYAEIDPAVWETAARQVVSQVLSQAPPRERFDVIGVGVDGQMHGCVVIDAEGRPLRKALLWPDTRAETELGAWRELDEGSRQALANPLTAGMPGPMLAWLARHEPEVLQRAHRVLQPKDWLRSRLVPGSFVTDPSDASATLLWDVLRGEWSETAVSAAGIDQSLLPPVVASGSAAGTLGRDIAAAWGLPAHVPVAVGCADVAATLLGSGTAPGRLLATIGSGAQIILDGVTPVAAGPIAHHTYHSATGGSYAMVAVMNAGIALQRVLAWLGADWDELYRPYDRNRDLPIFVPYLAGERLPDVVAAGAGSLSGLGMHTDRRDVLAAVLEGLCFAIRRAVDAMPDHDSDVIDIAGGGMRSPVFAQTLADVLQRPLRRVDLHDATAVGAATLGFAAAGADSVTGGRARREAAGAGADVIVPADPGRLAERFAAFTERIGSR